MKKVAAVTSTALLLSSLTVGTAFAFSDLEDGQSAAINSLKQRGIVSGIDDDHFVPKGTISYAQSVQMIVKGMNLNLDTMRFSQQPKASDFYSNIRNDAWYADAFIIAHYHNLDIPKNVNPNASVTREQFAYLLVSALEKKANIPTIKMFIPIKDEDQITPEYQGTLQRLLLYKITELDKNGKFHPKNELTRGEAATWVYNAVRLLADHAAKPPVAEEVTVTVEKVNDEINKVTLSRGEKPNAGYGIDIKSIRFGEDGTAVISYTLRDPQPDQMYADVVTEAKTTTYISAKYKAVAQPAA